MLFLVTQHFRHSYSQNSSSEERSRVESELKIFISCNSAKMDCSNKQPKLAVKV